MTTWPMKRVKLGVVVSPQNNDVVKQHQHFIHSTWMNCLSEIHTSDAIAPGVNFSLRFVVVPSLAPKSVSGMSTLSAGELFCNATDPRWNGWYRGINDSPSTDADSVHCASESALW